MAFSHHLKAASPSEAVTVGCNLHMLTTFLLGSLQPGEATVFGDYDGDGRAEPAVWRTAKAAWDILFRQTPR